MYKPAHRKTIFKPTKKVLGKHKAFENNLINKVNEYEI